MHRKVPAILTLSLLLVATASAQAGVVTLTDTEKSNNVYAYVDSKLKLATFDFTDDPLFLDSRFISLYFVSIDFDMFDGDTGLGESEYDELALLLDGYDSGLRLNGYRDDARLRLTTTGRIENGDLILGALLEDGILVATLRDLDAGDDANRVGLFGLDTTLELTAITHTPLPAAAPMGLVMLGGLSVASWIRRRRRRAA